LLCDILPGLEPGQNPTQHVGKWFIHLPKSLQYFNFRQKIYCVLGNWKTVCWCSL